jgi:arylsulfatase A-like enzyme
VKAGVTRELASASDIFPTLVEFAGAKLPEGHKIDGVSLARTLKGDAAPGRQWLFSYLGPGRILRDERYVLIDPGLGQPQKLLDGKDSRTGVGYEDVTDSTDAAAQAVREKLTAVLRDLPGPEGHPGLKLPAAGEEGKAKAKAKKKKKKAA